MNHEYIKYFITVVEVGSITKASKIIHVTSSGISQGISQLEKDLNISLFHREKGKMIITSEGKELLEPMKQFLREMENIKGKADELRLKPVKTYKIGTAVGLSNLVSQSMNNQTEVPEIIVMREMDIHELLAQISDKQLDFGVVVYSEILKINWPNLESFSIGESELVVLAHQDFYEHRNDIFFEDVLKERLVLFDDTYFKEFVTGMKNQSRKIFISLWTNSVQSILHSILSKRAITILPRHIYNQYQFTGQKKIKLLEILEFAYPKTNIMVVWNKERKLTPFEKELIKELEIVNQALDK